MFLKQRKGDGVMVVNFVKSLSASEAKYKYVGLPKIIREEFPPKDEIFKVKFMGKIYNMRVNNKNCIMLTQLYEKHSFTEDDELKIITGKKGLFEFTVNDYSEKIKFVN